MKLPKKTLTAAFAAAAIGLTLAGCSASPYNPFDASPSASTQAKTALQDAHFYNATVTSDATGLLSTCSKEGVANYGAPAGKCVSGQPLEVYTFNAVSGATNAQKSVTVSCLETNGLANTQCGVVPATAATAVKAAAQPMPACDLKIKGCGGN